MINNILEAAAQVVVRELSGGTCEYGKECAICDCNQPESDRRALALVSSIVDAIRPLVEAEVLEKYGVGSFEEFEYDLREQIADEQDRRAQAIINDEYISFSGAAFMLASLLPAIARGGAK